MGENIILLVLCKSNYGLEPVNICVDTDNSGRVTTGWVNRGGYSRCVVMVQGEWRERDIVEPIADIPRHLFYFFQFLVWPFSIFPPSSFSLFPTLS